MGSQGGIPGPRASMQLGGNGKSQILIDLYPRGARQSSQAGKGLGQAVGGVMARERHGLNPNREAGLMEVARRMEVTPSPPTRRTLQEDFAYKILQAGARPARLSSTSVHWRG